MLHYAAQQLVKHYNTCLDGYELHQRAWRSMLAPLLDEQPLPPCVSTTKHRQDILAVAEVAKVAVSPGRAAAVPQ